MADISSSLPSVYQAHITSLGFTAIEKLETGVIYLRQTDNTCLVIDIEICRLSRYPYVAYTATQNEMMAAHDRVFRFLFDGKSSPEQFNEEIELFCKNSAIRRESNGTGT